MNAKPCRGLRGHVVSFVLWLALATAFLPLAWTLALLVRLGTPGMDLDFVTTPMRGGGTEGGVLGQILGTLVLVGTALAVCMPGALGAALWIGAPLPLPARLKRLGERWLHIANAIPSVLVGLFAMLVFSRALGLGKSWLVGGLALGMMIVPSVALAMVERFRATPPSQVQASIGLGFTRMQVVTSVFLPRALGGAATGLLLGLARAAGETAPILFTATVFSGAMLPEGIRDAPVLALPYHIFVLAQDVAHPGAQERVWASALVLLLMVWLLALAVFPLRLRFNKILSP